MLFLPSPSPTSPPSEDTKDSSTPFPQAPPLATGKTSYVMQVAKRPEELNALSPKEPAAEKADATGEELARMTR